MAKKRRKAKNGRFCNKVRRISWYSEIGYIAWGYMGEEEFTWKQRNAKELPWKCQISPKMSILCANTFQTFMTLLWKGYYENLAPFRKDYEEKFGYTPYVHPTVRYCWYISSTGRFIPSFYLTLCSERGSRVSNKEFAVASERKHIYSSWLRDTVLGESSFNTIMIYPAGDLEPFYRDEYRK